MLERTDGRPPELLPGRDRCGTRGHDPSCVLMERDGIDLGDIAPGGSAALGPSGRSVTQQGDTSYNTRKHLTMLCSHCHLYCAKHKYHIIHIMDGFGTKICEQQSVLVLFPLKTGECGSVQQYIGRRKTWTYRC